MKISRCNQEPGKKICKYGLSIYKEWRYLIYVRIVCLFYEESQLSTKNVLDNQTELFDKPKNWWCSVMYMSVNNYLFLFPSSYFTTTNLDSSCEKHITADP